MKIKIFNNDFTMSLSHFLLLYFCSTCYGLVKWSAFLPKLATTAAAKRRIIINKSANLLNSIDIFE